MSLPADFGAAQDLPPEATIWVKAVPARLSGRLSQSAMLQQHIQSDRAQKQSCKAKLRQQQMPAAKSK